MAYIRVIHDPVGETLTVYWREPREDQISEETGEGVILIEDARTGEVIGFERLYYRPEPGAQTLTLETFPLPARAHPRSNCRCPNSASASRARMPRAPIARSAGPSSRTSRHSAAPVK